MRVGLLIQLLPFTRLRSREVGTVKIDLPVVGREISFHVAQIGFGAEEGAEHEICGGEEHVREDPECAFGGTGVAQRGPTYDRMYNSASMDG